MSSKHSAPGATETGKCRKKIIGGLNRIMETSSLLGVKNLTKNNNSILRNIFYCEKSSSSSLSWLCGLSYFSLLSR